MNLTADPCHNPFSQIAELVLACRKAETGTSVTANGVKSEATGVVPVVFGATFYPAPFTMGSSVRPCGSLAVSPYVGFATNSRVGASLDEKSVLESVLGFRVRSGADVFLSERSRIGLAVGYHFVSDFDELLKPAKEMSQALSLNSRIAGVQSEALTGTLPMRPSVMGSDKDYSGPEFAFEFGILMGGGKSRATSKTLLQRVWIEEARAKWRHDFALT